MLQNLKEDTIEVMNSTWKNLYLKNKIRRCSSCLLLETTPYIEYDTKGICNYCRNYSRAAVKGENELEKIIAPFRHNGRKNNCIVALSGGRDSSFGLHYVKKVLKLNPIAYTYDWGMATDIARRNQEKMCDALGVERIIIKADYNKKRRNIKRNIEAWLKKPDLGLVPIFMAGDKQAIYYAQKVKKTTGIKLIFHCLGNAFEDILFKTGFSKVALRSPMIYHNVPTSDKIKLGLYYAQQFLRNPAYINISLIDSFKGYLSLFFIKQRYHDILLYHYIKWDEQVIMKTLIEEYGWELPTDTCLTWRIDDGTSAFYNYIYMAVAGFTENDSFRSCQIREGTIFRDEAFRIIEEENRPRIKTIEWYAKAVGFDCDKAIRIINTIPKLYKL